MSLYFTTNLRRNLNEVADEERPARGFHACNLWEARPGSAHGIIPPRFAISIDDVLRKLDAHGDGEHAEHWYHVIVIG